MKRPIKHLVDYLFLSLFVSLAIILVMVFNGSRTIQTIIIFSLSLIYFFWGIIHHQIEGTFKKEIAFEYFLYALLGTVLALGLL